MVPPGQIDAGSCRQERAEYEPRRGVIEEVEGSGAIRLVDRSVDAHERMTAGSEDASNNVEEFGELAEYDSFFGGGHFANGREEGEDFGGVGGRCFCWGGLFDGEGGYGGMEHGIACDVGGYKRGSAEWTELGCGGVGR